jgi:hypothetical protein
MHPNHHTTSPSSIASSLGGRTADACLRSLQVLPLAHQSDENRATQGGRSKPGNWSPSARRRSVSPPIGRGRSETSRGAEMGPASGRQQWASVCQSFATRMSWGG